MFRPVYLCLVLAVFSVNQLSLAEENKSIIIDKLQDILAALQQLVADLLNTAQNKINDAVKAIVKTAQDVLKKTNEIIKVAVDKALETLAQYNEGAAGHLVEVQKCIENGNEAITESNHTVLNELGSCIDTSVRRAGDIADEAFFSISNVLGYIDDDMERFHNCNSVSCYFTLWLDCQLQLLRIPKQVFDIIDHTVLTILSINTDIFLCNADAVLHLTKELATAVADTKTCIDNIEESVIV